MLNMASTSTLLIGNGIILDLQGRRVIRYGSKVGVSQQQFRLLRVLMENAGCALTRDELFQSAWGQPGEDSTGTVRVHICSLRKVLGEPDPIITIRGYGYCFDDRQ